MFQRSVRPISLFSFCSLCCPVLNCPVCFDKQQPRSDGAGAVLPAAEGVLRAHHGRRPSPRAPQVRGTLRFVVLVLVLVVLVLVLVLVLD